MAAIPPLAERTLIAMKGVAGELPLGPEWVYEIKWDGMRALAMIAPADSGDKAGTPTIRLISSNGRSITDSFPELAGLSSLVDGFSGLILDGEIVALGPDGRPSFNRLQQRMHVSDPADAARRAKTTPVVFVIFDILHLDGYDTMALPFKDRRQLLERAVEPGLAWRLSEQHRDSPQALLDVIIANDLEGLMAKRLDSPWVEGKRSPAWVKVKPRHRQEFVVGGWIDGRNSRAGTIGSLILGYYQDGDLVYAGTAGSGLSEATIKDWGAALTPAVHCPFATTPQISLDGRKVVWTEPDQVAEVAFGEWTGSGQLRHPVILGRRSDVDPGQVGRE